MFKKLFESKIFAYICITVIFIFVVVNSRGVVLLLPLFGLVFYFLFRIYEYFRPEERARRQRKKEEEKRRQEEELKSRQLHEQEEKRLKFQKYQELRNSIAQMPKYQHWRKKVFEKYGSQCEICGTQDNLEIHHRTSFYLIVNRYGIDNLIKAFECEALWNIDNGSVICRSCHEKTQSHQYRNIRNMII